MDTQQRIEKKLKDLLLDAKVIGIEYLNPHEVDEMAWDKKPICITLKTKDGAIVHLIPQSDDEGNNGGAMYTNLRDMPIIPTL